MKILRLLLPAYALMLAACSNDFEVAAPWKEVPVVYAIISAKDTANYIRIEKAFLDPDKSALEIAQIPDSLYYPENAIAVYLERAVTGERFQLVRVDGNLEGYPREGGIFATSPNWLYKLKTPPGMGLAAGEQYRLVIERADGRADVTAVTTVPREFVFITPSPFDPKTNFLPGSTTDFRWRGDVNSAFFSLTLTIRYRGLMPNGSLIANKEIVWNVADNIARGTTQTNTQQGTFFTTDYSISGDAIFQLLRDNIQPDPNGVALDGFPAGTLRYFNDMSVTLEGGGAEIKTYLETAAANAGITGSEIITTYTNLSEGFGIFTAKNTSTMDDIRIEKQTVDAMNESPVTKHLNFRF